MKFRKSQTGGRWYRRDIWVGNKKKCRVEIQEDTNKRGTGEGTYWFRVRRKEDDIRYNSLWDKGSYFTIDDASQAAEKWIDENVDTGKREVLDEDIPERR